MLGKCGGLTSDIADGIIWASGGSVSGVPVNANPADGQHELGGGVRSSTTQNAINQARNNGAVVVMLLVTVMIIRLTTTQVTVMAL